MLGRTQRLRLPFANEGKSKVNSKTKVQYMFWPALYTIINTLNPGHMFDCAWVCNNMCKTCVVFVVDHELVTCL